MSDTGWVQVIPVTGKGMYLHINEIDGRVTMMAPFEPFAPGCGVDARYSASKFAGNVADLTSHSDMLHPVIRKAFEAWVKSFGKKDPTRMTAFFYDTPTVPRAAPHLRRDARVDVDSSAAKMTYADFRKAHPAVRCFQKHTSEQRATLASSHRLSQQQRQSVGEFYYVHNMVPGIAFPTAKAATTQAFEVCGARVRIAETDTPRLRVAAETEGHLAEEEAEAIAPAKRRTV